MPNRNPRTHPRVTPAEIRTCYVDHLDNELLDAIATAAALVALADGRVEPVELSQLIDFLDRSEFLSVFTRGEILDVVERRVRELREPDACLATLERLGQHADRQPAQLIIDAGEEVAAADCRLDPSEQRVLRLIRIILAAGPWPSGGRRGQEGVR